MPRCLFCDTHNPTGARRCAACGAELATDDETSAGPAGSAPESGEPAVPVSDPFEREVLQLLATRGKIAAIKHYRLKTSSSLKDAKDAVEGLAARHGVPAGRASGCAAAILILTLSGAAAWRILA